MELKVIKFLSESVSFNSGLILNGIESFQLLNFLQALPKTC